ncbi:DNA primase [Actinomycetaceae bacterium TAE3-ERU4]|nr:DNA primase [Actinomycetaceae bacterium TAE3-ERU4]
MAGLIRNEDIAAIRQNAKIEDIVSEHVTLRSAGVGSMKGLCPFHDEKTPSFHVRPTVNLWHCFGCGEGGDVISFVQRINHQSFTEAVEYLASRLGYTLTYEEGQTVRRQEPGKRQRLVEAHRLAENFFIEQLASRQAGAARAFLGNRGFDAAAANRFGVGYAPDSWDTLLRFLRRHGFTEEELAVSGLFSTGSRGIYDRFRGRLMWPIRDITGATVGFGARRLGDDDKGPKYLNTPETPIYKKSQVLYGLDLAKKSISTEKEVVVVEGYTDVMAAHLAGITNAVATCGTAFGTEHAKILSRLIGVGTDSASSVVLADGHSRGGRVIFTFDGDAAGQKAALRAFHEDQRFASQTYVAIASSGMDPCDLRLAYGDEALRQLIEKPKPLFDFVVRNSLAGFDLETVEGRVQALQAAAPVVSQIRDTALRNGYIRELASWISMPLGEVKRAVQRGSSNTNRDSREKNVGSTYSSGNTPNDPVVKKQAQALATVLQYPQVVDVQQFDSLSAEDFSVPSFTALKELIESLGGLAHYRALVSSAENNTAIATERWLAELLEASAGSLDSVITRLSVGQIPTLEEKDMAEFARGILAAVTTLSLTSKIARLRSRLSRGELTESEKTEVFENLLEMEKRRRELNENN